VGAKNTLDRNYLYLAEGLGTKVRAETEVTAVRPRAGGGYSVFTQPSLEKPKKGRKLPETVFTADKIVFAGGVMGTVPLLLSMRDEPDGLPKLSPRLGDFVRTNNEALVGIVVPDSPHDFTKGVAIGSILHTDEDSHFEPIHYGRGSGFFRLLAMPHTAAPTRRARLVKIVKTLAKHPRRWAKALFAPGMSTKALTVVFMQTLDSTLSLRLKKKEGKEPKLVTRLDDPNDAPTPFIDGAEKLIKHFTEKVDGVPVTMATEFISAVPTTAHILGGCCMGEDAEKGVIDSQHRVYGHDGLYVIDGSAVSSNPGVNPSLSITALAERAMSFVPARSEGVQA
jgi:cholesterol oxidase